MSEFQRYEFMTIDRPLTQEQLDIVKGFSSHIEASSTHAIIEYQWGNFKHDPIKILHKYFDGFFYWANWGSRRLAFRFPHGIIPDGLIDDYDLDDYVTFKQCPEYDILDINFGEMETYEDWTEYELGSFLVIREELMDGDLRALYIVWLAAQCIIEGYENETEEEDYEINVPVVPPNFDRLTAAENALAKLLEVPEELLVATGRHSKVITRGEDFTALVKLLPPDLQYDYLVRLAYNEPGLNRNFVRKLRELSGYRNGVTLPKGEHVTFAKLQKESKGIKAELERKKYEKEQQDRLRHLKEINDHRDEYWNKAEQAVMVGSGAGYDEALRILLELREASDQFLEIDKFKDLFHAWVRTHLKRPAFIKRLQDHKFQI